MLYVLYTVCVCIQYALTQHVNLHDAFELNTLLLPPPGDGDFWMY